jgi:formate dehydrogenase subunit beta
MFLATELAAELSAGLDGDRGEADIETAETERIRKRRSEAREALAAETRAKAFGLDKIVDLFASCVGCRACRTVCPICYCRRCEFEAPRWELTPEEIRSDLDKRGGLRVPSGTVNFHVGRMIHMGVSCVGCGMCTDVCPADIPVSEIFTNTGRTIQALFDYVPGRDVEEKIPVTTFEEEELSEVER